MGYLVEIKNEKEIKELLSRENPSKWAHNIYLMPNAWISRSYYDFDEVLDEYTEEDLADMGCVWVDASSPVEALAAAIS